MMTTPTAAELIIIAIFAAVTMFGIWWGVKRKRERVEAEATTDEHREAMRDALPDAPPPAAVVAPPVTAAPPIVDTPVVAATPPMMVDEPSIAEEPPIANEPIAAAAAYDASPATLAADIVANTPVGESLAGNITQLKGLGPKLAAQLAELGITRVDQIAVMSPAEIAELDAKLGTFKGRIARDRWVEQAKLLSVGDRAGYEAEFGKLGG
ncbi:putative flap endonuclease-1-like 5' DNA nuclease [Sphingomonas sp. UYAg733]